MMTVCATSCHHYPDETRLHGLSLFDLEMEGMSDAKKLVAAIFDINNIKVPPGRKHLLQQFIQDEKNKEAIDTILENQDRLMAKWTLENRIADIMQQPVKLLNGTVGKSYETRFDFKTLKWDDISSFKIEGLDLMGLGYDDAKGLITGVPTESGDRKIIFRFKLKGQADDQAFNEKIIPIIINPDPRSLWKTLESDKNDPYWKEDDVTVAGPFGDRHLVVSSKRGRSHANVGSFREDDFAFSELENGWNIVVVADGAGSAKISRKGSELACASIISHFKNTAITAKLQEFDGLVDAQAADANAEVQTKIRHFVYNNLGNAVLQAHKTLEQFATSNKVPLKDLNSTLIFALVKKYSYGYAVLTFGVGDCPIAVLNKDHTEVTLMNWLDVGEFGGGTRFITMPEIFRNEKFASRFAFRMFDDFSYLFLMSDGIYDPKFVVENALADITKWQEFLKDLGGENEDKAKVNLDKNNQQLADELSRWMDFWSPGNHDDRTLAIVF